MKIKSFKLFLIFSISLILGNDTILWDMGMIIKEEKKIDNKPIIKQKTDDIIHKDALRTSPFIAPTKQSVINNKTIINNIFEPIINSENKNRILKKLISNYLNQNYKNIIHMIDNSDLNQLNINEQNNFKYFLADAFLNVGNYKSAQKIIIETLNQYPEDRFYILNGMAFENLGNYKKAKEQYKKILTDYRRSEYYLTAKIKCQVLSHN